MPRPLRIYLLACIALAFGYLVLHAAEPLRLSVGDPWTDASVINAIAHAGPADYRTGGSIAELVYGAVGAVFGTHEIAVFRVLALVFSGLAAWLMYQWARRVWTDTVAIIATALTTTSLLWLQFADSIHRAPIVHAACFLALWGTARVLETGRRAHYLAAFAGTVICLSAAPNDWLFLPAGVLFTIQIKSGNPLARDNWRVLALCTVGALLALLIRAPFSDPTTWQAVLDHRVATNFATLLRRYASLLTPMVWLTLAWAVWRALRAPSVRAAVDDGTTWLLVVAVAFSYLPAPSPESATLRTQLVLPLYAIGSGLLIARLFERGRIRRALAIAWCAVAPVWGLWLIASYPRAVLARADVAETTEYLARSDRNSFVISNLLSDGPLVAAFGRHGWPALREPDPAAPYARMIELFEATGSDTIHAVIFTTPSSRFVDRSIAQALRRRMPAVDGWPSLVRRKVNSTIAAYDAQVMRKLEAVGAKRVLRLSNYDVYRLDRAAVLEAAARAVPATSRIDFASVGAIKYQLAGWGDPLGEDARTTRSSIAGFGRCRNPIATGGCTVVRTPLGLDVLDVGGVRRAELAVRVERACEHRLTIELAEAVPVGVAFNGTPVLACGDPQWAAGSLTVRVPRELVRDGLNIIRLDDAEDEKAEKHDKHRPEVRSVVLEPVCEPSLPSGGQID